MAHEAYIRIKGKTQGQYPAEVARKPHEGLNRAAVLRVDYRVSAPTDIQKTSLANERRHEPITILKEVGAMTALLNQAANRGEVLENVEIVFYKSADDSEADEGLQHYFTIELENARVTAHRLFTGKKNAATGHTTLASSTMTKTAAPNDTLELEEFTLWFRTIKVTAEVDKRSNSDDWDKPQMA